MSQIQVKNWDDSKEKCNFLYVNAATYMRRPICKVGISVNPKKRLLEFNNGLRHRFEGGYINEPVTFSEYFVVSVCNRDICKTIERKFLETFCHQKLRDFGREVFLSTAEDAAIFLNKCIEGEG